MGLLSCTACLASVTSLIKNMENNSALKIEALSASEEEAHSIVSPMAIETILRNIGKNGSRVVLYYGGENYFILTTLMGIDHSGFWLEQSPNNTDNKRITECDELFIVSSDLMIKVQFAAGKASNVEYEGYPAFHFLMPKKIYRLQRREYFRINPLPSEHLRCVIPVQPDSQPKVTKPKGQRLHQLTIMDISAGGVKLTCSEEDVDLEEGQVYEDCQVDLPDVGTINVTITVKSVTILTTKSSQAIQRAGCEFTNIDGASSILLQRYVTNLQRSAKAQAE
jgi:c-di-GMP-binding flagellar brake protein YcgR